MNNKVETRDTKNKQLIEDIVDFKLYFTYNYMADDVR